MISATISSLVSRAHIYRWRAMIFTLSSLMLARLLYTAIYICAWGLAKRRCDAPALTPGLLTLRDTGHDKQRYARDYEISGIEGAA